MSGGGPRAGVLNYMGTESARNVAITKAVCLVLSILGIFLGTPQLFAQTGSISASPNPCAISAGQNSCTSTLRWTAQNTTQVKVFVSHIGATATNFATSLCLPENLATQ